MTPLTPAEAAVPLSERIARDFDGYKNIAWALRQGQFTDERNPLAVLAMIKSDLDQKRKGGFDSLLEVIESGMSICYNAGHENQQAKLELHDARMRIDTL